MTGIRISQDLLADLDYVEKHTTNTRLLSVCRGLHEAIDQLKLLERKLVKTIEDSREDVTKRLAMVQPQVISRHCPVCKARRVKVAQATARWRQRRKKTARASDGAAAYRPRN
jgi:hypothetical protein